MTAVPQNQKKKERFHHQVKELVQKEQLTNEPIKLDIALMTPV